MPRKYQIRVSFDLATTIEPDFYSSAFDPGDVEEFSDESSFYGQDVECSGGDLRFVVEAESAEEAEERAAEVIEDGSSFDDGSGFAWEAQNVSYDVELVEVPMDLPRAKTLVGEYIAAMEGMDEELQEAFTFLLDLVTQQASIVEGMRLSISAKDEEIRNLSAEYDKLAAATATPFDPPTSA